MMNFNLIYYVVPCLILCACSKIAVSENQLKEQNQISESVPVVVDQPKRTEFEKVIFENPLLSKNEICIIFFPEDGKPDCNLHKTWVTFGQQNMERSKHEYSFAFPDVGDFHISIKIEEGLVPFQRDERNLFPSAERNWISNLSVVYKEEELIVPISTFASLPTPNKIEVILDKNDSYEDFSIRFYSDGFDVSQFNFSAFNCGEEASYELESTISWLPRMFGDSYQKTFFKTPLCN